MKTIILAAGIGQRLGDIPGKALMTSSSSQVLNPI